MWLLDTSSFALENLDEEFATEQGYAILSHTWATGRSASDEVIFQDLHSRYSTSLDSAKNKRGWQKIQYLCDQARTEGIPYAWLDTCCIDKTSSAELSEAINSMYRWYIKARKCYAFLQDVKECQGEAPGVLNDRRSSAFSQSRWFTRGWTLQELIAPPEVYFFNEQWSCIGTRTSMSQDIETITGIPIEHLNYTRGMSHIPAAQKLSWAAKRQTTRPEDRAYSMLGIFNVNMPLLYGEGEGNAFMRLQLEILRTSHDLSLLLWVRESYMFPSTLLLPQSVSAFASCGRIERCFSLEEDPLSLLVEVTRTSPLQLRVRLPTVRLDSDRMLAVIGYRIRGDNSGPLAMKLDMVRTTEGEFACKCRGPVKYEPIKVSHLETAEVKIFKLCARMPETVASTPGYPSIELDPWCEAHLQLVESRDGRESGRWLRSETLPALLHFSGGSHDQVAQLDIRYENSSMISIIFKHVQIEGMLPIRYCKIHQLTDGHAPEPGKWLLVDRCRFHAGTAASCVISDFTLPDGEQLEIGYYTVYGRRLGYWHLFIRNVGSDERRRRADHD